MASEWINHVKKYAKENGIKYGEALSKAGATFKKSAAAAEPVASPAAVVETPQKVSNKSKKSKKSKSSKKSRGTRGTRRR